LNGHNFVINQVLIKRVELLPYRELLHKQNKSSSNLINILLSVIIQHVSTIHMCVGVCHTCVLYLLHNSTYQGPT